MYSYLNYNGLHNIPKMYMLDLKKRVLQNHSWVADSAETAPSDGDTQMEKSTKDSKADPSIFHF